MDQLSKVHDLFLSTTRSSGLRGLQNPNLVEELLECKPTLYTTEGFTCRAPREGCTAQILCEKDEIGAIEQTQAGFKQLQLIAHKNHLVRRCY